MTVVSAVVLLLIFLVTDVAGERQDGIPGALTDVSIRRIDDSIPEVKGATLAPYPYPGIPVRRRTDISRPKIREGTPIPADIFPPGKKRTDDLPLETKRSRKEGKRRAAATINPRPLPFGKREAMPTPINTDNYPGGRKRTDDLRQLIRRSRKDGKTLTPRPYPFGKRGAAATISPENYPPGRKRTDDLRQLISRSRKYGKTLTPRPYWGGKREAAATPITSDNYPGVLLSGKRDFTSAVKRKTANNILRGLFRGQ